MRTTRALGRILAVATVALLASPACADEPDVATIVGRMKAALDPPRPSVRTLEMTISAERGAQTRWTAKQARKTVDGRRRVLTVMLAPETARGIALLVDEGDERRPPVQWTYVPSVRRVRKLTPLHDYDAFLNSDFTNADLGFTSIKSAYTLLGTEDKKGKRAYKVQAVPEDDHYYKRTITWVDTDTFLPLERVLHGPAGEPWKVHTFENVTTIGGIPTALKMRMDDTEVGSFTEIVTTSVEYGVEMPDGLFEPTALSEAVDSPVWRTHAPSPP
jgi:hypothetical protein